MAKKKSKTHITTVSILDDLGFSPEQALSLKVKAQLHSKIIAIIEKDKYTAKELEELFEKPQPRISELLNGKISQLSIEKLLIYLAKLGSTVSLKFKKIA